MTFRKIIGQLLGSPVLNDKTVIKTRSVSWTGMVQHKSGKWYSDDMLYDKDSIVRSFSWDADSNTLRFELYVPESKQNDFEFAIKDQKNGRRD